MDKLYFGTGGTPNSTPEPRTTISGIERIAALGLGCMEIEFVQGVKMGEAKAAQVAEKASSLGIKLTAHAPYFINFNAAEPEKIKASQGRLLQTARIASLCGAFSVVFHTAFYMEDAPEKAYIRIKKSLEEVLNQLQKEDIRIWLRPEVMGRPTQFGTIDEVLRICSELPGLLPCIDFAHWHARTNKNNTFPEFATVLRQLKETLGKTAIDNMHMHVSGISYGKKGEIKHLNFQDSEFRYAELMKALKKYEAKGVVVCESPNLEEDALVMQQTYNEL